MRTQYLIQESNGATKYIVGKRTIKAPSFIPEIGSLEDIEVILRFATKAMEEGTPILVSSRNWRASINNPRFTTPSLSRMNLKQLVRRHSVIFYEPPELFRYTMPELILSYALDSKRKKKEFKSRLEQGKKDEALKLVPEFYRQFIERQIPSIHRALFGHSASKTPSHVADAWRDDDVKRAYLGYITNILGEASKIPNSAVVPTVPPLLQSSYEDFLKITRLANLGALFASARLPSSPPVYYHLYVDWMCLRDPDFTPQITAVLETDLKTHDFCGVVVTLTGYEKAQEKGEFDKVESFVNDIVNVSHQYSRPVILPRSKWEGLYLTDLGVQAFSSLLNGNRKHKSGGWGGSKDDQFGKVPLPNVAKEYRITEVKRIISKYGGFPNILGLPTKPSSIAFNKPKIYRVEFAKPWRLCHCYEANLVRDGLIKGVRNPARRYLERSEHPYFGNNYWSPIGI